MVPMNFGDTTAKLFDGRTVATGRRWTLKNKNGRLSDIYISDSKRELERKLVPEYVGDDRSWNYGYRRRFEEDLERRLREDGDEIVEVEMTLMEVR